MTENVKVPTSWAPASVGAYTRIRTGKLDANAQAEGGIYPFFTCGDEILRINNFAFDTEAVLLAGNGNFNVKWYRGKFNAYQRTYVIEPIAVNGKFLYYQLVHLLPQIVKGNRGSTVRFIRIGDITDCPSALPPLGEQVRIVEAIEKHLSCLDAGVAALKRVQANLKRYRASVLKAACEGRLVPTEAELARRERRPYEPASVLLDRILAERRSLWEGKPAKYLASSPPNPDAISRLPVGWVAATVEQVSSLAQYGSSSKTSEVPEGIPVLRMGNLTTDGRLELTELKYLREDHDEFPDLLLQNGDLLFNRTNSAELVGKSAVYRGNPEKCSFASYLIRIKTLRGCDSRYLALCINSKIGRAWIKSVVSQQVGQANVNGTKLQAFVFPLPPESEQHRILSEVDRTLSVVEEQELMIGLDLSRAERLRQSILKRAFEGKLVPQDPNDEPASILLERIRGTATPSGTAIPGCAPVRAKSNKPSRRAPVSKEAANA